MIVNTVAVTAVLDDVTFLDGRVRLQKKGSASPSPTLIMRSSAIGAKLPSDL